MNNYISLAVIVAAVWVFFFSAGVFKSIKNGFDADPGASSYRSSRMRDEQSDKARELEERNRRMMDSLKEKAGRNKF